MKLVGSGFIKRDGGFIERADLFETKKGTEFAVTPDGLYLMAFAYEPEECYEIESEADVIEIGARLDKAAEAGVTMFGNFIPGATG